MDRIITVQHKHNGRWRNLCWLLLLAVFFQTLYVTNASAFALQTTSIYTICNHLSQQHNDRQDTDCMRHCASAIDHFTQDFISGELPAAQIDSSHTLLAYFNPYLHHLSNTGTTEIFQIKDTWPFYVNHKATYLRTARLRI